MIQRVGQRQNNIKISSFKGYNKAAANTRPAISNYADSFVKHAAESTPMLLGLTLLWSLIDNASRSIKVSTAIKNNFIGFFLPVNIASSLLLAIIENKKTKESKK